MGTGGVRHMAIETLGAALRQINRLFADGAVSGLSDAQLLERFLARRDAGAFEALVARHGPMVLSVCRAILRDPHDAEDAFQATFLVLVKKAGTIRGRDTLAGWLHRVAYRVAIQANAAAARRRRLRKAGGTRWLPRPRRTSPPPRMNCCRRSTRRSPGCPRSTGWRSSSATWRACPRRRPPSSCDWSRRTLQRRLAEGRERLKARLARRGLAPDGAALAAVLLREARTAVPAGLARGDRPRGAGRRQSDTSPPGPSRRQLSN